MITSIAQIVQYCKDRFLELFVQKEFDDVVMLDTVARKIGEIARNNIFRVIILDTFKITKFTLYGFRRSEKIAYLHIQNICALICNEIYFIFVRFTDLNVITSI